TTISVLSEEKVSVEATAADDFIVKETTVFKVDSTGELVLYKDFHRISYYAVDSVLVVSDGFILVGQTIAKTDFDGNVKWQNKDPYLKGVRFYSAVALSDGFIAVGTSPGKQYKEGNYTTSTIKGTMAKYSYSGKLLWEKTSNWGGHNQRYMSVVADTDGYVTTGSSEWITSSEGPYTPNIWTYIVSKYDQNGSLVWENKYSDYIWPVVVLSDGLLVLVAPSNNGYVEKIDGAGDTVWKSDMEFNGLFSVTVTPNELIFLGYKSEIITFTSEGITSSTSEKRPAITILKTNGDLVWKKIVTNEYGRYNDAVAVSDGYVVVGSTMLSDGYPWKGPLDPYYKDMDAVIVKFNKRGDVVWKRSFGGEGTDLFRTITGVPNGFVLTGISTEKSFGNGDWIGVESVQNTNNILVLADNDGNVREAFNIDTGSGIEELLEEIFGMKDTTGSFLAQIVIMIIVLIVVLIIVKLPAIKKKLT
ncbi:MAG: hypothetical protein FWC44_00940, partial [Methanomassiliicoccaceae archaeon]|nr:hypothetical protein [Methanomassiliicoccaceae archaeon]